MENKRSYHFLTSDHHNGVPPPRQGKKTAKNDEKKKRQQIVGKSGPKEYHLRRAKPINNVVKVSGKGKGKKNHFASFEYNGIHYDIEDFVLFRAEKENQKPYVAILKDITQTRDGSMMVRVQWFYRPEDLEKEVYGNLKYSDSRELFYSFHEDEIPVESIMHKCVVHFVPLDKQIPYRKQYPGFIVRKVYDTNYKKLFMFTDNVYTKNKREEIDFFVQKTISRIGELPNIKHKD